MRNKFPLYELEMEIIMLKKFQGFYKEYTTFFCHVLYLCAKFMLRYINRYIRKLNLFLIIKMAK